MAASCLSLPPHRSTLDSELAAEAEWKAADVLDGDALYRVVAAVRPDCIYHLAGFASAGAARSRPEATLRVNAGGTVNLLEAIVRAREDFPGLDPLVLVMASAHVYGRSAGGAERLPESAPLEPVEPYGLSKVCQEAAAHAYRRGRGIRTTALRAFHLIGPGQKPGFVLPDFCAQVAAIAADRAQPVVEVGNLDAERDFTDVRDAVVSFRALAGLERPDPAYNICSGVGTRIGSLLEWILAEAGVDAEIRVRDERLRKGETERLVGDPGRLRRATAWEPVRPLRETVADTYRWTASAAGRTKPPDAGPAGEED